MTREEEVLTRQNYPPQAPWCQEPYVCVTRARGYIQRLPAVAFPA